MPGGSVPQLTDAHNELYDFLISGRAYGTAKGQISNEREFIAPACRP